MTASGRTSEAQLLADVRLALGREPDLTLWRNNTGAVECTGRGGRDRLMRYGLCRGSSDLVGILAVNGIGVSVFIEVKTETGRLSDEQILFRDLVVSRGAIHITARTVDDARRGVEDARRYLAAKII